MTSLHVDLNEAAKCIDLPLTLLASLSRIRALVQNTNGNNIWPNLWKFELEKNSHLPTLFKGKWEASGIAIVMVMAVKQSIFSLTL